MPIVRLQEQTIMPFIIVQQLHMPPASIVQRFCIMLQPILSSQEQVIFIPPGHFSNFIVQRGIIIMFMPLGIPTPVPAAGIPVVPMPVIAERSTIIVLIMEPSPCFSSARLALIEGPTRRVIFQYSAA
jgi:hypothetical protein